MITKEQLEEMLQKEAATETKCRDEYKQNAALNNGNFVWYNAANGEAYNLARAVVELPVNLTIILAKVELAGKTVGSVKIGIGRRQISILTPSQARAQIVMGTDPAMFAIKEEAEKLSTLIASVDNLYKDGYYLAVVEED